MISIVIPAYNEGAHIKKVISKIPEAYTFTVMLPIPAPSLVPIIVSFGSVSTTCPPFVIMKSHFAF